LAPSLKLEGLKLAGLLLVGTLLGLAGIDLILPAVPTLPQALGGSLTQAQGVLAAYSFGTGVGLILFGALGARWPARVLLPGALGLYGLSALAAAVAPSLEVLIALRFVQGLLGACPAVLAPGILRALFPPERALRAIAALGSAEALAPALAPVFGALLLTVGDWRLPFWVLGALALGAAGLLRQAGSRFPVLPTGEATLPYGALLRARPFPALALAYACALASLLVYVFAMPTLLTESLGGTLKHFIAMQITGILTFMVAANSASALAQRFGARRVSAFGGCLSTLALGALLAYAAAGGRALLPYLVLFVPVNLGLGFRGPLAFMAALDAAGGNDARASALMLLTVMLLTGLGTLIAAPTLGDGARGLTLTAFLLAALGLVAGRWGARARP
jgi:DHA1 family bicyclomycin/chloramphenicol resistance-like MFS transporter